MLFEVVGTDGSGSTNRSNAPTEGGFNGITREKDLFSRHNYSMLVWVLADNPACRFYEALGTRYVSTKQIEIGGMMLDELSYGWCDIRSMQ